MPFKVDEDAIFTPVQIANLLGTHTQTIRNWIKSGYLKAERFGSQYGICGKYLNDFFENR